MPKNRHIEYFSTLMVSFSRQSVVMIYLWYHFLTSVRGPPMVRRPKRMIQYDVCEAILTVGHLTSKTEGLQHF